MANNIDRPQRRVEELSELPLSARRNEIADLAQLLGSDEPYVQSRTLELVAELSMEYPEDAAKLVDGVTAHLGDDVLGQDASRVIANVASEQPSVVSGRLPLLVAVVDSGGTVTVNITYALAALAEQDPDSLAKQGVLTRLFTLLNDDDVAVRANVTRAVSEIAAVEPDPILDRSEAIRQLIHDDSSAVQQNALYALGHLGEVSPWVVVDAMDEIYQLLESDDPGLRAAAAYVLGSITRTADAADDRTVGVLAERLHHESAPIRQHAAFVLGEFATDNPDIVEPHAPAIARRMADSEPRVRQNAIMALRELRNASPSAVRDAQAELRDALETPASVEQFDFTSAELRGLADEEAAPDDIRQAARETIVLAGANGV